MFLNDAHLRRRVYRSPIELRISLHELGTDVVDKPCVDDIKTRHSKLFDRFHPELLRCRGQKQLARKLLPEFGA